jgi:hypothetical protein
MGVRPPAAAGEVAVPDYLTITAAKVLTKGTLRLPPEIGEKLRLKRSLATAIVIVLLRELTITTAVASQVYVVYLRTGAGILHLECISNRWVVYAGAVTGTWTDERSKGHSWPRYRYGSSTGSSPIGHLVDCITKFCKWVARSM